MHSTQWQVEYSSRTRRQRRALGVLPEALPLLTRQERSLLTFWLRSDSQTRTHASLMRVKSVDVTPELADTLCQRLLASGWVSVRETLRGGVWQWDSLTWTDLDRLKSLMGVGSRAQRQQARAALLVQADQWLRQLDQDIRSPGEVPDVAAADDTPLLSDRLAAPLRSLQQESLSIDTLRQRLQLLQALAQWSQAKQQGTRRDFALYARDHTKGITPTEWKWLDSQLDLEVLGVSRFAPTITLAGNARLCWNDRVMDTGAIAFLTIPLLDAMRITALTGKIQDWWLIENRASFERQCSALPDGTLLIWLPGRPSPAWLNVMRHWLQMAPAPLRISADIDPSGVDIACTVGGLWREQGLPWEPCGMDSTQLALAEQSWSLSTYDLAILDRLMQMPDLPASLRELCRNMQKEGKKAEQEGWL